MSKKEEKKEKDENQKDLEELTPEEVENMTEEQLEDLFEQLGLLEDIKKSKNRQTSMLFFNYALHKKFGIHIIIQTLVNIIVFSAVLGLTRYGIIYDVSLYFLSLGLFTVVEIIVKLIFFRFFQKLVIRSYGLIHLTYLLPSFYLFFIVIGKINFTHWYQLIITCFSFYLLRFFTSYYIRVLFLHKRIGK